MSHSNDITAIAAASRLGEVQEYYFSRKLREIAAMRASGKDVLNLGIGSPDLPPHPDVIEVLTQSSLSPDNHAYQSYSGLPALRTAFANWYARFFEVELDAHTEILPLIGSKEGIMHISMSFLEAGDEVLVPDPGYPAYRAVANLTGATVREYALEAERDWLPDLDKLGRQDLSRVKIMWVNYPNMPTGARASKPFFEELVAFARRHQILLCHDNPYAFILNEEPLSLLSISGAKEVVLELNSLSKSHNMAGWRVGMLAGREDYLQTVLRFKSNMDSGMFKPIQLAAVRALSLPANWYEEVNNSYRQRRALVFRLLDQLHCRYETDQVGMFVWAKVPELYADGYALADEVLRDHHVFITPGGIFGSRGLNYIRVSLCSPEAVFEQAISRLQTWNRFV